MAVGDIYQVMVRGHHHGQVCLNVFHYACTINGDADDADGVVNAFRSKMEVAWLACCSGEYAISGYIGQKIHPLPVASAFTQEVGFSDGTVAGNSLPSSVAVVLTKRTAIGGRKGRGRVYMPAVPSSFEEDSQLTLAALGTYSTLANLLNDPLVSNIGGSYSPCIWHRATNTFDVVTDVIPRPVLRNQRRRQVGRGI